MKLILTPVSFNFTRQKGDQGEPTIEEAFNIMGNAMLTMMRQVVYGSPDKDKTTEELYDLANTMYGRILIEFAPEIEHSPDFSIEAMQAAEDLLLETRFSEIENKAERQAKVLEFIQQKRKDLADKMALKNAKGE
jgi:hypothetical protein